MQGGQQTAEGVRGRAANDAMDMDDLGEKVGFINCEYFEHKAYTAEAAQMDEGRAKKGAESGGRPKPRVSLVKE